MREAFETWAKAEIARLRDDADALQHALDKYLESQGTAPSDDAGGTPSTIPRRRPKLAPARARKGSKRSFVLSRIGESINGVTTDELWGAVQQEFPDMKRSSLRALLYVEAKSKNIERRDGRYIRNQGGPGEPTPGPLI